MFTDKYGILVEDAKDRFIRGKSYEKIISLYAAEKKKKQRQ